MRLEFEPNVTAFPLVENEAFEHIGHPTSPDLETLLKQGIAAAQDGDRERARTLLTEAAEIDPRSEDAWMWLASISDYPEELLAFLNHVLYINPKNERALEWRSATRSLLAKTFVQRAIAAHEDGSADLAVKCLDQALGYDNDCEMAWFWKASMSKVDEQKLEYLERVLEINPENHEARDAIASIRRIGSENIFDCAKAAAVGGKRKKALELVDEFLKAIPDNAEAWILRSHLSLNIDDKMRSLEKALAIDPDNATARSGLDFLSATVGSTMEHSDAASHEDVAFASQPTDESIEIVEDLIAEASPEVEAVPAIRAEDAIVAEQITVESLTPAIEDAFGDRPDSVGDPSEAPTEIYEIGEVSANISIEDLKADAAMAEVTGEVSSDTGFACPFCKGGNDPQAFECTSCHATLTLSDIESLFSNQRADRELIQQAVTQMEAEWNLREFSEEELTALGIGHFNLNNFDAGYKYLQEASRLNPNNVILSGQVNAIAIRLDEMRRMDEAHDGRAIGKTILVVDDSPTVRKLISGKLEKSGHSVVCAVDGVEALARLEESLPDLVLLDITMPRMDGYEVCKQIRSNPAAKDIPVVMISGKDGFFDKVRGRMAGSTGYVTKPFGPETLMKALETYLLPDEEAVS